MKITFVRNDISNMDTDAIVLPANPELKVGPGTSKAIFEAAGWKDLEKACNILSKHFGLREAGTALATDGFALPAEYIIHAVVPYWKDGNNMEYENLCAAYLSSLMLADGMGCKTIAIPVLASGNNKFDPDLALDIAIKSIMEYEPKYGLEEAVLTLYGFNLTNKVKDRGFEVTELIDTKYEFNKDERVVSNKEKAKEKAVHLFDLYVLDAFRKIIKYLDDPVVADNIHKLAAKIVIDLLNIKVDNSVELAKDAIINNNNNENKEDEQPQQ